MPAKNVDQQRKEQNGWTTSLDTPQKNDNTPIKTHANRYELVPATEVAFHLRVIEQ